MESAQLSRRRTLLIGLIVALVTGPLLPVTATTANAPDDDVVYLGKTLVVTSHPLEITNYCGSTWRIHTAVLVDSGEGAAGHAVVATIGFFGGAAAPGDRFLVVSEDTCPDDPGRAHLTVIRISTQPTT